MTRTSAPIAVALSATAALLLAACGGGGSEEGPDKIEGANSSDPTSAAPTASESAADAPTFDLPSDVKVNIDGFTGENATQNEALLDTTYAIKAVLEAQVKGDGGAANYKRYWTGLQGAKFADTINDFGKSGKTITGSFHYYRPTVKLTGKATAGVTYCEDQRKGYAKNRKTGKVEKTTPSLDDFSQWSLGLAKNTSGDWQVIRYAYTERAKSCQIS
ncbi:MULTISPECIES: hypothetical protein [unclassified Streptomyces]|uniref:hypothetical protein n=1 Tax=unclassified Streptomyces TaxID=2593676 RepID=UPI003FD27494